MPNLVHSLDASNVHLLCNNLTGQPLYTIQDCFATTPNNMEFIEHCVKDAFIKIYFSSGNYLEKNAL
jgi:DNA-directed RNA polymerase